MLYTEDENITNNKINEAIIIFPLISPSFLWLLHDIVVRFPKHFIRNSEIFN